MSKRRGRKAVKGINDLATVNPDLTSEYASDLNCVQACELLPFSNLSVKWRCEKGHVWSATVASRSSGAGCPFCSGRRAVSGINDLV